MSVALVNRRRPLWASTCEFAPMSSARREPVTPARSHKPLSKPKAADLEAADEQPPRCLSYPHILPKIPTMDTVDAVG